MIWQEFRAGVFREGVPIGDPTEIVLKGKKKYERVLGKEEDEEEEEEEEDSEDEEDYFNPCSYDDYPDKECQGERGRQKKMT